MAGKSTRTELKADVTKIELNAKWIFYHLEQMAERVPAEHDLSKAIKAQQRGFAAWVDLFDSVWKAI